MTQAHAPWSLAVFQSFSEGRQKGSYTGVGKAEVLVSRGQVCVRVR